MLNVVQQKYEVVIGLEIHVQLKTHTKLFCACSTKFGQPANENTCPVCLAHPGVLPVLNEQALEYAVMLGLALNCDITPVTKFDRKQYFYPDLPKGYQISQYDKPICQHGHIDLENGRRIRILRAHLEEDAGKLVHAGADGLHGANYSLVDLNRAGTPLLEIVSEPDIRSADEAREYLTRIRNIVRYLGVCDGNLEQGSMRCDANVSIRPVGQNEYGTKTEIKNMNSFKAVHRAIESEVERQAKLLDSGERVRQESRLWNEATQSTILMRSKEEAHDYRYFEEPDLRPVYIQPDWVQSIRSNLPILPEQRLVRLIDDFQLSPYDASVLVEFKELGDFFEAAVLINPNAKAIANWLMGDVTAYLKSTKQELGETQLTPHSLAELVQCIESNQLSSAMAKQVLPKLLAEGNTVAHWIQALGLSQITDDSELQRMIDAVVAANPDNVAAYKAGKDKLFGFFVGQVMKASQGQANPERLNALLKQALQ